MPQTTVEATPSKTLTWRGRLALGASTALLLGCLAAGPAGAAATPPADAGSDKASGRCRLGNAAGDIQHVIYIQFDNTHFRRDLPTVPSDLEQMPSLLNFINTQGTLNTNDHTILISHTAGGILTSLTGVYPDRHGQTVSNSYVRTSATGNFSFVSSFAYWIDTVSGTIPNMVTPTGANAPAPWVAYTRAGCDVGGVGTANIELENTDTGPGGDITEVFGANSPQYAEAVMSNNASFGTPLSQKAQTDFVGLAIHCARGSHRCAAGQNDLLPQEPGGYAGYKGLFGAQEINPLLTGKANAALPDLFGKPIADSFGQPGFPGFDGMLAEVSLAYVAAMQEHGVPVTYAYISDAHDDHVSGQAYGPGEAGYVQQLASYDHAFAAFFARLARAGIDATNTLFVFTVDEGDHFDGGTPSPANCDGVKTPCVWDKVGEVDVNIDTLVANQFPSLAAQFLGSTSPDVFTVHGDDAPPFYLANFGGGPLGQTDPLTRQFERSMAQLTAVNPYTGATDHLLVQMGDQTEMKALHMITTGDPARNATFVFFGDPTYYITDFPSSTCETCIDSGFAWNHGDIQPEIANTWFGIVGPGVKHRREVSVWTDHTDLRPTMLELLGLSDSYELDGRVVTEVLSAYAPALGAQRAVAEQLGGIYKQINAPFGAFGMSTLMASTRALAGDDATYTSIEGQIAGLTAQRDALAAPIRTALNDAAFHRKPLDPQQASAWIAQAQSLLDQAAALAAP
ncbi:MAG TPA: alkaline phosphatase family protein [Thermoanaerobaculia bacterium]|nr:alkaline phosphatase family protein [Thermoanaerobaculia bacterium]